VAVVGEDVVPDESSPTNKVSKDEKEIEEEKISKCKEGTRGRGIRGRWEGKVMKMKESQARNTKHE
jgi:hypothetical protein